MAADNYDSVPPTVRVLLAEQLPESPELPEMERFSRRLLPELRRQAEWTRRSFNYADDEPTAPPSSFVVTASGSLNPFSGRGICSFPSCRVAAAEHFARTLGLYSDIVTIPDAISGRLLRTPSFTKLDLLHFVSDVLVLRVLRPLIEAGIVRFRNPIQGFCDFHYRQFEARVDQAVLALLPQLEAEVAFELDGNYINVQTGRLYEPSLTFQTSLPPNERRRLQKGSASLDEVGRELFAESLRETLREVLVDMNAASKVGSSLFSASRLDMLSLSTIEGMACDLKHVDIWEEERSVELPWIKELSPQAVVALRQEADRALPRFREQMLQAFALGSEAKPQELIADLRRDAAEVEAEIKSLNVPRGKRFRGTAGVLGVTISVYGFAAGFATPAFALGSLASLLGLLHTSARKDEQELAKLESRPGYVLLKARELFEHCHGGD